MKAYLKNYSSIILLLAGIAAGSVAGLVFGEKVEVLKPIGDIFLNLLFTAVIPLVFFAISSALANIKPSDKLSKMMWITSIVFLSTVLISAILTMLAVRLFPVHESLVTVGFTEPVDKKPFADQLTGLFTTTEFYDLLSRQHMLAMIVFSVIIGFATLKTGKEGAQFAAFLNSGNAIFKGVFTLIMKIGPIGLGAYFAYQVGVFGPQLFSTYAKSLGLYYSFGAFYFIAIFSLYAFVAGGVRGIRRYWKNNLIPSATAVGTCSSIAVIPSNLDAAKKLVFPIILPM